jgi:hypothetical protein
MNKKLVKYFELDIKLNVHLFLLANRAEQSDGGQPSGRNKTVRIYFSEF